jgi:hypothetical protein
MGSFAHQDVRNGIASRIKKKGVKLRFNNIMEAKRTKGEIEIVR